MRRSILANGADIGVGLGPVGGRLRAAGVLTCALRPDRAATCQRTCVAGRRGSVGNPQPALSAAAMISSVAPALLSASTIAESEVGRVIGTPHTAPPGAPGRRLLSISATTSCVRPAIHLAIRRYAENRSLRNSNSQNAPFAMRASQVQRVPCAARRPRTANNRPAAERHAAATTTRANRKEYPGTMVLGLFVFGENNASTKQYTNPTAKTVQVASPQNTAMMSTIRPDVTMDNVTPVTMPSFGSA
jgi:hypothetical protein